MTKSHEEIIRFANEEILVKGNLQFVDETFSNGYVLHAGGKEHKGPAFVKRFTRQLRTAIPDLKIVEIAFLIQNGNTIAWRRTFRGTHRAALKGIPASGRKVIWRDLIVSRFAGKKISEDWAVSDLAAELMFKIRR